MLPSVRESLLSQPVRKSIYDQIGRFPGINKSQVAKSLDLSYSHVDFHLERLKEHGLVVERPGETGPEILLFCEGDAHLWDDPQTRVLYGRSPKRNLALCITEEAGTTAVRLAKIVDRCPETVRHHLKTLTDYGLIQTVDLGHIIEYHPTERLLDWVETVGSTFPTPLEEGKVQAELVEPAGSL